MIPLLTTLEDQLRPEHTALLVIDMQNDFCAEGGYLHRLRQRDVGFASSVAHHIEPLVAAARQADVPVVWIRSHYDPKYLLPAHLAKRGEEACCIEGTWGADFFMLRPAAGDEIVDKHHFSGFRSTRLDDLLRSRGIRTLLVTGVATNVCVDSTLREGFFLGYHIVVPEDCVGSSNKVGHDGTLATVRTNIGSVTSSEKVMSLLAQGEPGARQQGSRQ